MAWSWMRGGAGAFEDSLHLPDGSVARGNSDMVGAAAGTGPWTAALDLEARHDPVGVFEYACHEGNYGREHMLKVSRMLDKPGGK